MADNDSRKGAAYHTAEILHWLEGVHRRDDAALRAAFDAPAKHGMPPVMVGHAEGAMLGLLLRLLGARKVVEVGTLAGYSTIHMARALPPDGRLYSVEFSPQHAEVARANLSAAGVADRVEVRVGAGVDVLPTLEREGPFDAVFIDADKGNYDRYGRWAAEHLRVGGMLIGDNVFYFGRLLDEGDEAAGAMRRFHAEAAERFDTVVIPTPDGQLVGIKR
ncbi:MAG: O-methyltransferase [Polyangiales bacterium]